MTIKTAEEILEEKMKDQYDIEYWEHFKENNVNMYAVLLNSMQEYAKQFIDAAAEQAGESDGRARAYQESILKLKEMVK